MLGASRGTAHLAGLSGLPFDRLWLALPIEIVSDWESRHENRATPHADAPPVEMHSDLFLVKGSAVSDAALSDARAVVRAYLELKVRVRRGEGGPGGGEDEEGARLLARARGRMWDLDALRKLRHGARERRLSQQLLGYGQRGVRSVAFPRQYARLRLLLLAGRGDAGSPLQAVGGDALALVAGFLVPWRVSGFGERAR